MHVRLLKSIPILIRDAFKENSKNDPEKWQLAHRFFIVDTISGLNEAYKPKLYNEDRLMDKFNYIRFLKSVELVVNVHDNHEKNPNQISVPLLKLEYQMVNASEMITSDGNSWTTEFNFKITYNKKHSFDYILEILLPIFILLAFTIALFQTYCYKIRQGKIYYDMEIFFNFLVYLISNVGTALLAIVTIITLNAFFLFKTQEELKLMMPIEEQIDVFIYLAFIFKFLKLLRVFWLQKNIDIFFIDWERPKIFDTGIGLHRSHFLDTPSIASNGTVSRMNVEIFM